MAHKKGQGTSRNGRDSNAQRRGVKKYGDEYVLAGNIKSTPERTSEWEEITPSLPSLTEP